MDRKTRPLLAQASSHGAGGPPRCPRGGILPVHCAGASQAPGVRADPTFISVASFVHFRNVYFIRGFLIASPSCPPTLKKKNWLQNTCQQTDLRAALGQVKPASCLICDVWEQKALLSEIPRQVMKTASRVRHSLFICAITLSFAAWRRFSSPPIGFLLFWER